MTKTLLKLCEKKLLIFYTNVQFTNILRVYLRDLNSSKLQDKIHHKHDNHDVQHQFQPQPHVSVSKQPSEIPFALDQFHLQIVHSPAQVPLRFVKVVVHVAQKMILIFEFISDVNADCFHPPNFREDVVFKLLVLLSVQSVISLCPIHVLFNNCI